MAAFTGGPNDTIANWAYGDLSVPAAFKGSTTAVLRSSDAGSWAGVLNFNLGCGTKSIRYVANSSCGNAASMAKALPTPLTTSANSAISLKIRNPGAAVVAELSVTDSTGQVLTYRFDPRTIESPTGTEWALIDIPLTKTRYFYRGANDGVVHGPITRVTIGAGSIGMLVPPDQLQIQSLQLNPDTNFTYRLDNDAALVAGAHRPNYAGRLAIAMHALNSGALDKAKEIGITTVRRDLKWADIERKGVLNFGAYDKWTTALGSRGMSVVWILDYGHPDHGNGAPVAAADRAAFANFAATAADHYKGKNVIGFEVWNEPNYAQYWAPPDADAYGVLLGQTVSAIKATDPSAKVLSAGVSVDGIKELVYLTQLAQTGALKNVDQVAIHPYRATKPETLAADLTPIAKILAANGVTAPASVTEWGYGSYGYFDAAKYGNGHDPRALNHQAVLTLRSVLTQLSMDVPLITIYDLVDDCAEATNRECNFGLLLPTLDDKPAMTAMRTLFAMTRTRAFKGVLSDVPPVMHAMRWDGATDKVYAVWVDTPGANVQVALPSGTSSVVSWNGVSVGSAASNPAITLTDDSGPIFITVPN